MMKKKNPYSRFFWLIAGFLIMLSFSLFAEEQAQAQEMMDKM
jgi:hypothetical protein